MTLFSLRLKWLREKRNMSQKELAEKIGVSQQYYNKFEKGTGQPNLETLWNIRDLLDEPLDFIIGYTLLDIRGDDLYDLYVEARRRREECEEDIEYLKELMAGEGQRDENKDFERMKEYREELKFCKEKEERSFKLFFDHASSIPGFDDEFSKKEYWVERYASQLENDKKIYHEFQDNLHKL